MLHRGLSLTIGDAKLLADIEITGSGEEVQGRLLRLRSAKSGVDIPLRLVRKEVEQDLILQAAALEQQAPDEPAGCTATYPAGMGVTMLCARPGDHQGAHQTHGGFTWLGNQN